MMDRQIQLERELLQWDEAVCTLMNFLTSTDSLLGGSSPK
jgi:hypothetical protein